MYENKLPEKLQALLKDQEEVEHLAQPTKESYDSLFKKTMASLLIRCILINGFVSYSIQAWFTGLQNNPFGVLVYYLIFNLFNIELLLKAMNIKKSYPNSFYAYSNMRLFFTDIHSTKVDYVYYKDIQDLKVERQEVVIDTGDTYNSASEQKQKRLKHIIGVQNPENFVKEIDQKLLKYRMPS